MILADKIIRLRKKNGWSQEELAEKMNVSRQAVAKWEGAQTAPNIDKILQLGELFGVTTDYLLKDEIEEEEFIDDSVDSNIKRVTLSEANDFLEIRKSASIKIALGSFLCILSVIPLLILGALSEYKICQISEELACGAGLIALLVMVSIAVAIFLICGFQSSAYEFFDKGIFELEYGVRGMVRERQKNYRSSYVKFNIIGSCICIISPIPLFAGIFFQNEFYMVVMLTVMLALAGVGTMFFIIAGVRWASMQKILNEGEFTPKYREKSKIQESVSTVYWLIATAVYLGYSFTSNNWHTSWIIWPIAGVLFAAIKIICNLFINDKE